MRAGRLEPRFNLILTRLQAYRQASDYAYAFTLARPDVDTEIAAARELVDRAEAAITATPDE